MTWKQIKPTVDASAALASASIIQSSAGKFILSIMVRQELSHKLGWKAGDNGSAFIGSGEHAGFVRVEPDTKGSFKLTYLSLRQGVGYFRIYVANVPGLAQRKFSKTPIEFEHVGYALVARLPDGFLTNENNEPQPKAEQPEGAPLAPAATTVAAPVSGESAAINTLETAHGAGGEVGHVTSHAVDHGTFDDGDSAGLENEGGDHEVAVKIHIEHENMRRGPVEGQTRANVEALGSAVEPGAPHSAPSITIKDRILDCLDKHPDWSARQIAEECGTYPQRVYNEASNAGISLAGGKKTEPVQARKPEPAPMPQPEPKRSPTPSTLPNEPQSIPSQRMTMPNGTRFRLREHLGRGKYLNLDGSGLTEAKAYSWIGNEKQLLACRVKFPAAQDLVEEVIS